jgi:hypothetical protein
LTEIKLQADENLATLKKLHIFGARGPPVSTEGGIAPFHPH